MPEEYYDEDREVSMSFAISWKNLWNQEDTFEQTSEEERREWIHEFLDEIRSKYKRRTKKNSLADFELAKWDGENMVMVIFPKLKYTTAESLKEDVNYIIAAGQISQVQVYLDREPFDVFDSKYKTEQFKKIWMEQQASKKDEKE